MHISRHQHFRHFHANQSTADNHGMFYIFHIFFHQFQILIAVQPLHSFQVLAGPPELVGNRAQGKDQSGVFNRTCS